MKKLLPILIGLSLTGFSAMSQAENLLQVYQQARISNPICVNRQPIVTPHSKRSTKRAVHYCLSSGWERIIPIPAASVIIKTRILTSPAARCS